MFLELTFHTFLHTVHPGKPSLHLCLVLPTPSYAGPKVTRLTGTSLEIHPDPEHHSSSSAASPSSCSSLSSLAVIPSKAQAALVASCRMRVSSSQHQVQSGVQGGTFHLLCER